MKKLLLTTALVAFGISFFGCGSKHVIVRINSKDNEVFTKNTKAELKKSIESTSIVLRVPTKTKEITEEEESNENYDVIEKVLLKGGFNVRDRALFNELVQNKKSVDYSAIQELTNTDLILEIQNSERVPYTTNKYYSEKGKEHVLDYGEIKMYGLMINFKLISVGTNEIIGSYDFHFSPCEDGCRYKDVKKDGELVYLNKKDVKKAKKKKSKEEIRDEQDLMEGVDIIKYRDFLASATNQLIESYRNAIR